METTKWFMAPLFAALALIFAGCGGSDDISEGGGGGGLTDDNGNEVTAVGSSREKATLVAVGNSSSHIIKADGEHWFKFEGTGEKVIFETTGSEVDTYIDIYSGSSTSRLDYDDNSGEGYNALISRSTTSGTTYFIKITARNNSFGTYGLVINVSTVNGRLSSMPVTAGYASPHTISQGDEHWFKLEGTDSNVVFKTESNVVNTNIVLYIGDATSAILTDTNQISFSTVSGTAYYIRITTRSGGYSGTYTFSAQNGASIGLSRTDAVLVTVGNSSTHTITSSGENWFSFVGTGEKVIFETTGSEVDTYIDIYSGSSTSRLDYDDNSGEGYNALISRSTTSGTTYFIKITARNNSYGTYGLVITASTVNGRLNSMPVTTGYTSPHTISQGDEHWFKLEGTGSNVIFKTESNVVNTTVALYIGDATSAILTDNNQISFSTVSGTAYYIRITTRSGGYSGTYTFSAQNGTSTGLSRTDAIPVKVGNSSSHSITLNGENWFSFAGTSEKVTFETTGSTVDTYIDIYSGSSTSRLDYDDNSGEEYNALVSINTTSGTIYWIKITAKNNSSGTYGFIVRNPD